MSMVTLESLTPGVSLVGIEATLGGVAASALVDAGVDRPRDVRIDDVSVRWTAPESAA
jgi:hypothetical protein